MHLSKFENQAEYEAATLDKPAVSLVGSDVVYDPVSKIESTMSISLEEIREGDDADIRVDCAEEVTGYISLEIGGQTYTEDVIEGRARFSISGLTAGTYTVTATLYDDVYTGTTEAEQVVYPRYNS